MSGVKLENIAMLDDTPKSHDPHGMACPMGASNLRTRDTGPHQFDHPCFDRTNDIPLYAKAIAPRITTPVVPYPLSAPWRAVSVLDDQGCDHYFTDAQDRRLNVAVPKTFDVGNPSQPTNTPRKDYS